jgi:hypothetical protein
MGKRVALQSLLDSSYFVGLVPTLQGDPIDVLIAQSRLKGRRSGSQSAGRARRGKKNTALPTPVSASWC